MFRRRTEAPDSIAPNSARDKSVKQHSRNGKKRVPQTTTVTAETAHVVGPGCLKIRGRIPQFRPVDGPNVNLHPRYLRRLLCYGNVDISTATLQLFWRHGIQVTFLSPNGNAVLGKLQPHGKAPNLPRLQHLAASDPAFRLRMATDLVAKKIASTADMVRYYQRQGKGTDAGKVLRNLERLERKVAQAGSVASLLGLEGTSASRWVKFYGGLLPSGWEFNGRKARPPADPVNSLLSLGYTLAHSRCETMLAAADLDPAVGFLHDIRPGRSSLACDLVEPLRVPLVDRLVLMTLGRRKLTSNSFHREKGGYRLGRASFKGFLADFERAFSEKDHGPSWKDQTEAQIKAWIASIRAHSFDHPPGQ